MVDVIKEAGCTITCMDGVSTDGQMDVAMKVSTNTIKSTDLAPTIG